MVAILSVIARILFPVLVGVKREAHRATCTSNLLQVGKAIGLYASDWIDTLPNGRDGHVKNEESKRGPTLVEQVASYVPPAVFECPADFGVRSNEMAFGEDLHATPKAHVAFGSSYFYLLSGYYPRPMPFSSVGRPAEKAAVWDASGAWHRGLPLTTEVVRLEQWEADMSQYQYQTLFFDGHVRGLSRRQLAIAEGD